MSLLDFDNDDAGVTVTTTTDAGFYGNTASIDDPFGFDVFGSNSTGSVKTKSGSADVAKTGNPFDDFDPFGGFGDGSSNVVTTTTSFSATSSSFSKPATDNQFAFDDDFSNNNPTGVVTETNTHLWGGGGDDDDFHKGGSSLEEPNGGSDVIHGGNGVIHGGNDVTHDHHQPSSEEEITEFNQDRGWKPDHTAMAEKDNTDDFEYQFKAQPDNRRHDVNSHRGQEDDSLADYFSSDNRGRISIDEIRQRSYEDMEPLRSASSHDRNQKEQKTTTDSKTPSVYVLGAASDSTCKVCSKRVYEMEKITADLQVYHKTCFRCTHCSRILSLGNFSTNEGRLYCKPHFMEIFKTKGNYKEGFAAAERNRQQGDRHDISDPEDQQGLNGRSRHSSEENGLSRMRHSSSGREEEYDEADDGAYLQEEIPVVQIKSVRSMFEKMSQDKASHAAGQPKKAARTSQVPQSTERGQGKQADQVRRDSLRSEGEREEHERRGSVGDREVVQSSTVCIVEEELPPPSFTKSMLAKFRMMEDVSGGGGAKPALPNYGKPASSKQPSSGSTGRHHQTLANRSSSGSNEDDVNETTPTSRQHSSAEEQADELPQAGHAKSLLAQWRNIEEQTKQRGRNRELKKTSTNARRSQSMSRVETVQRANVYRNIDLGSPRSKQAEDIGRSGSYSDQEASEDDAPVSMPTKRSLAKFKELEGGQSMHETDGSHKAKRKFKWEVKEAVPLNRGGIIVHGDVPKRPTTEAADVVRGSEGVADNVGDDYDGRLKRNDVDGRREFDVDSDDVVHQSVLTVFNEDELPAPATTRTLLQHFKSMEDVTKAPPLPRPAPSEAAREARSKARPAAASGAVHSSDSDYDEAYRNQKRHSVHSDSEDIQNADAAKESDACDGEELPAQGTTRSLLAKFQSFQTKN